MRAFADLYAELDASTSTLHKVDAIERYLARAAPVDAAWAVDGQPVWDVPDLGVPRYADGFHYNDVGAADGARIVSLA